MIVPDYRNFQYSNELYHYGMPRRSGRYPYGSGERPFQSVKERRQIKKENKQKKKLMLNLNYAVTKSENDRINLKYSRMYKRNVQDIIDSGKSNKWYNWLIKKYEKGEEIWITDIEKNKEIFDSTLNELKEHGVDLDNIRIKSSMKIWGDRRWIGNEFYIKDEKK